MLIEFISATSIRLMKSIKMINLMMTYDDVNIVSAFETIEIKILAFYFETVPFTL